jgi:hypothetical protein
MGSTEEAEENLVGLELSGHHYSPSSSRISSPSFICRFSPFNPPFPHRSRPRHLPFLTVNGQIRRGMDTENDGGFPV